METGQDKPVQVDVEKEQLKIIIGHGIESKNNVFIVIMFSITSLNYCVFWIIRSGHDFCKIYNLHEL